MRGVEWCICIVTASEREVCIPFDVPPHTESKQLDSLHSLSCRRDERGERIPSHRPLLTNITYFIIQISFFVSLIYCLFLILEFEMPGFKMLSGWKFYILRHFVEGPDLKIFCRLNSHEKFTNWSRLTMYKDKKVILKVCKTLMLYSADWVLNIDLTSPAPCCQPNDAFTSKCCFPK